MVIGQVELHLDAPPWPGSQFKLHTSLHVKVGACAREHCSRYVGTDLGVVNLSGFGSCTRTLDRWRRVTDLDWVCWCEGCNLNWQGVDHFRLSGLSRNRSTRLLYYF